MASERTAEKNELGARVTLEAAALALDAGEVAMASRFWAETGVATARAGLRMMGRRLGRVSPLTWSFVAVGMLTASSLSAFILMFGGCDRSRFARLDTKAIASGIELFALEHEGASPGELSALVPRYLKELRKDPWGNDYGYARLPGGALVISFGPDGRFGGGDDIFERVELKDDGATAQLQSSSQVRLHDGERLDITQTSPDHYRIKRSRQCAP